MCLPPAMFSSPPNIYVRPVPGSYIYKAGDKGLCTDFANPDISEHTTIHYPCGSWYTTRVATEYNRHGGQQATGDVPSTSSRKNFRFESSLISRATVVDPFLRAFSSIYINMQSLCCIKLEKSAIKIARNKSLSAIYYVGFEAPASGICTMNKHGLVTMCALNVDAWLTRIFGWDAPR